MNNLALSYFDAGRKDEAIEMREEVLARFRKALGEEHPDTLSAMNNLAISYRDAGRIDEAGRLFAQLLLIAGDRFGVADEKAIAPGIIQIFQAGKIIIPAEAPSDEAVTDYYKAHLDQFSDTTIHLRMISGLKPAKTREFMKTLRKELSEGGDFAAAAKEHSDDFAASDGGDRGWSKRGGLREDLDKAAFALKAGEFSEVIEDDTHFRILNVVERRDGTPAPLSEVRDEVIAALKEEAQAARIDGWIEEAKKELVAERKAREAGKTKSEGDGTADE